MAGITIAAPAENTIDSRDLNLMAAGQTWTIQHFKRVCTTAKCSIVYSINTNDGSAATKCSYSATDNPASHASYNSVKCGKFTIGSSWSSQFGDDNAYTTLSVVKGGSDYLPGLHRQAIGCQQGRQAGSELYACQPAVVERRATVGLLVA